MLVMLETASVACSHPALALKERASNGPRSSVYLPLSVPEEPEVMLS